ncbi:hypothetical protein LZZ90_09055 [Flavobacterium sp. SM15]|uniref:GH25 family lysozyme n=1 Tax=Flavobacterium sp. SM15 TaxID=2908005 RepID=UPI001EDA2AD4|nr:GH25 family lysozyme [Flavobacterium sp. SM15]MCG2611653.1 hypothetical protein [Flavobacterium sp. SM15]
MTTPIRLISLTLISSFSIFTFLIKENNFNFKNSKQNEHPVADSLIYGIDLSHYQGDEIEYLNAKGTRLTFVICKATEGLTYTDPDFKTNWDMIDENGFVRGAYHFYHCADDPTQQANYFLSTIGKLDETGFPPIVDFEENSIDKSCNKASIQKNLLTFLKILEQKTGRRPILYTDTNIGNSQINSAAFANYTLWIADYNNGNQPDIPSVWKTKGWVIWQKNPNYNLDNYSNDYDVFNGSDVAFLKFLQKE